MSDQTQGETEEQYLERIKSVPGTYSDYNETAHDVVTRPERLVREAEIRADETDLAPEVHPEGVGTQDDGAVGFVYPGTDAKSLAGDSKKEKDETPEPEEKDSEDETPVEDAAEDPVEEKPEQPVAEDAKKSEDTTKSK